MYVLKMSGLKNVRSEKCPVWKMSGLKMSSLKNAQSDLVPFQKKESKPDRFDMDPDF